MAQLYAPRVKFVLSTRKWNMARGVTLVWSQASKVCTSFPHMRGPPLFPLWCLMSHLERVEVCVWLGQTEVTVEVDSLAQDGVLRGPHPHQGRGGARRP